jgi:hypothetical protein
MAVIWVDDIVIMCGDINTLEDFKKALRNKFKMTDLGPISLCLGMEIHLDRDHRTITLSQARYTQDVLARFGMADCKPASTPMDPSTQLRKSSGPDDPALLQSEEATLYRELVGSLM